MTTGPHPRKAVTIVLQRILDIAAKGVRRSYAFMALGVNAASDPNFKQLHLTNALQVRMLPDDLDDKAVSNIKHNFRIWVTGCGLRELIESFSVFLDEVYKVLLFVKVSRGNLGVKEAAKKRKSFSFGGVEKKLEVLRSEYSIGLKHSKLLDSVNQARNCISHRRGVVGNEDCKGEGGLSVRWVGPSALVIGSSGKKTPLTKRHYVEEDSEIAVQFIEKSLDFPLGKVVDIPAEELAEICLFIYFEARDIIQQSAERLKGLGIPIVDKSPDSAQHA